MEPVSESGKNVTMIILLFFLLIFWAWFLTLPMPPENVIDKIENE